jgi:hypothetical protein
MTTSEKAIRMNAFNIKMVDSEVEDVLSYIDTNYAGESKELEKQKAEAILRLAAIQEMINIDASAARPWLDKWKEKLGEAYYDIEKQLLTKQQDQLVEGLRNKLNAKYNEGGIPNFNKMEDAVQRDKTLPDEIKDSTIAWIKVQEHEYNARVKKQEEDWQEFEMDGIFEAIRGKDYLAAYQKVLSAKQLTQVQKYRIEEIIKSERKEKTKTDEHLYIELAKLAMTPDSGLERSDIIDSIGNGLDVKDGEDLLRQYKVAREPGMKALNQGRKDAIDAIEKQITKGNQLVGYDTDSVNDAYEAVKEFEEIWNDPPKGVAQLDLINPKSKHYIIEDIIQKYHVPIDVQIERMTNKFRLGDSQSRKEGETIQEYDKRTGKKK